MARSAMLALGACAIVLCLLGGAAFVAPPASGGAGLRAPAALQEQGAEFLARGREGPAAPSSAAACLLLGAGGSVVLAAAALARRTVAASPARAGRVIAVGRAAFDASKEIGACDPLLFWDPIGFCEGGTKEDFDRRRAVELKHGRVCMFAAIGMVWPDIFGKFNGFLSPSTGLKFEDVPSGLGAITKVPLEGWAQILVLAGVMETQLFKDKSFGGFAYGTYGEEPGNFGTGYWGRKIEDPAERRQKLTTEVNNGRLAMISVTAMLVQNGLTGQSPIEQLASGHISPFNDGQGLFATAGFDPSNELGAVPPLGYWDPFGMMAFGDKARFDRNRELELKHGRICMFATIGMVWPDIFGKFNGFLSPSTGLKFEDVPSGLGAITKVPLEGWAQILVLAGVMETQLFKDKSFGGFAYASYGEEPGNFGTGYWGRKIEDPAERRQKLTTELNNGRLAMISVTAMLVQNGLTGQSPIEQLASGHISPFNDGQGLFASFDPSSELGAVPPLGYWDPFGMMAFQDKAKFDKNRELELKHGRICMVATIGMVVPDIFGRFPGYLSPSTGLQFSDIPCSIDAIYKVPVAGWLQIFALCGLLEAKNLAFPTNYGWPAFLGQINKLSPEDKKRKLTAEINNGRLAMMAMAAMVAQNGVTGQSLVEQFSSGNLNPFIGGYAEAPRTQLHAAQSGAPGGNSLALPWAPTPKGLSNNPVDGKYVGDVGFDPLGFAENTRLLPWYREAELAHGRCCMLAVLGYSVQTSGAKIEPFITRYPTDSADPLKAATQVPIVGWLQILAVITLSELWRYENVISKYDEGVAPGDLGWNPAAPVSSKRPTWFGPTFTSKYTKEEFDLLKLREIKHARLAMFGFGFMLVQNAATGKGPSLIPSIEKPEYAGTVGDFIPKNL
mmetsp:Transcript_4189/g.9496  ORF Transcript_4189/g.9496 Transcript_4189/m.9496 type:complete len:898 (-) Transcript_4189:117-2810(-)